MRGFPQKLIPAIICQDDGENLISSSNEDFILNSFLKCSKCNKEYQIKDGICYMSHPDSLDDLVMKKEIESRDSSAKNYDKKLSTRYYKEVPTTLNALGKTESKNIIEYGSGTGRITEHLFEKTNLILASDFSVESLKILQKKLENFSNIGLVYSDVSNLKTKKGFFDKALSVQVLEHIPSQEKRESLIRNCYNTLKNDGVFVCSAYHQDIRRKLKQEPQEGTHPSGIFFHYFSKNELIDLFKPVFSAVRIRSIDITLSLEARLHLPKLLGGFVSRVSEYIPFLNNFGHLLLVRATK